MIQEFGKEIHHSAKTGGRPTSSTKQILVSLWMLAYQEFCRYITTFIYKLSYCVKCL